MTSIIAGIVVAYLLCVLVCVLYIVIDLFIFIHSERRRLMNERRGGNPRG